MPGTQGAQGAAFLPRELCPTSPPQPRSPGAGSRHPCAPPFPSCTHRGAFLGGVQQRGWPRVPGAWSWRWRTAPAQLGRLYLLLAPAGRNKGLFGLWGVRSPQGERWGTPGGEGPAGQGHGGGSTTNGAVGTMLPKVSGQQLCPLLGHSQLGTGGSAGTSPLHRGHSPASPAPPRAGSARWTSGTRLPSPTPSASGAAGGSSCCGPSPENPGRHRSR